MRIFHFLELENFKRFGAKQRIELDHPAVLIGPNNCGKTSAIQAIALWSMAARTWIEESANSQATVRAGKPLNRLNIMAVPVPRTRFFWHDLKVTGAALRLTVGFQHGADVIPLTMELKHHASDELVYCQPSAETGKHLDALRAAGNVDVTLLYPMSGIAADEAVILPARIAFLLGRGSTAEVLRNLCLQVAQHTPADWNEIVALMQRLFQVELRTPTENERGAIDLAYSQAGARGELDVSLSGRGFQQFLLLFAYLFSHKRAVLLIDEPDAHLELLRQRQAYSLLREVAARNDSQVILVTHSEVILDDALDRNLSLIVDAQVEDLAGKASIRDALKHYGAANYVKAVESGHVLYVEGTTDLDILRALAVKLEHPVAELLDQRINVYYVQDNYPGASAERDLERVEGGFGVAPIEHFGRLRKLIHGLRGVAVLDNDGKGREDHTDGALSIRYWKRYEAENYFVTPQSLRSFVQQREGGPGLFDGDITYTLDALTQERVFGGDLASFATYRDANPQAAALIWDAKTERIKLSDFAEEFFRRLAVRTRSPMLLRKGELHRLVAVVAANSLAAEVGEKLDALRELLIATSPES